MFRYARHCCACLALAGALASARPAGASTADQGLAAATNMAAIYQRLCLEAFPDPQAMGRALEASQATRLPPHDSEALLNGEPGSAWHLSTATADYTLTIEDAPYTTCALRRMTRDGFSTALPYVSALQSYARRRGLVMGAVGQLDQVLDGGASETVLATPLTARPKKGAAEPAPAETSMYVTTDFHGHYTGWASADAEGGSGVEIRMAHHIAAPP